ncbi:hypothetical protein [Clostridium estertheticum]|uniref:hypothetical protein n=1 Tax=Clostridium estertheticum TaxID=238834 RepID=UPI001CF58AB3|nr:hypothetical protein [Clostridium estertheticum]MCB2362137.1 hypothetical protein [Clostridium estertheticum]
MDCDSDDSMPMTLYVEDKEGNAIVDWKPKDKNWWCTGFNPEYQNAKAANLNVHGSIDFSGHPDLWNAFYKKYKYKKPWKFDPKNHIARCEW